MGVSVYWLLSVLCVFMCVRARVCDIKSGYQQKKHVSDLSKLDVLLLKLHIKVLLVLRCQGSTCVK